jgi:hypothetical protein
MKWLMRCIALTVLAFPLLCARADEVILDDLIVDGSACIGFDSVNGEIFGADTLRLKENNLRIHFHDTSGSASFPRNDWRLVINDAHNGGDDYFAVEDATASRVVFRVDAGAPNDALRVASSGNVGFGTGTPQASLHLVSSAPVVRFDSGAQVWDMKAHGVDFEVRDVSHGNSRPLQIDAGAPTDAVVVKSDGKVGIGTSVPSAKLHVAGDLHVATTLTIGSSRKVKEDIAELALDDALDALSQLKPVRFRYKTGTQSQMGFIAEDVPGLLATPGRKSVRPMDFVAVLTKVVQEHQRRMDTLRETVSEHDERIEDLAAELERMGGSQEQ